MDDDKRVSGLLEMASQHMKRFRELEEIEWKINFSIWALLGGFAYLWVTAKITEPTWFTWLRKPYVFLLAPIPTVLLHGAALFMLHKQQQAEAKRRNHYRDQAEAFLSKEIHKDKFQYLGGIRGRDWRWIGWSLLVTFLLAESVLFLMQTTTPRSKAVGFLGRAQTLWARLISRQSPRICLSVVLPSAGGRDRDRRETRGMDSGPH
jgi:hypothetical protein